MWSVTGTGWPGRIGELLVGRRTRRVTPAVRLLLRLLWLGLLGLPLLPLLEGGSALLRRREAQEGRIEQQRVTRLAAEGEVVVGVLLPRDVDEHRQGNIAHLRRAVQLAADAERTNVALIFEERLEQLGILLAADLAQDDQGVGVALCARLLVAHHLFSH